MVKNLPANTANSGLIPGLRRSPPEGNGNPLQFSFLENYMDRRAWWAIAYGIAESDMTHRLNNNMYQSLYKMLRNLI